MHRFARKRKKARELGRVVVMARRILRPCVMEGVIRTVCVRTWALRAGALSLLLPF